MATATNTSTTTTPTPTQYQNQQATYVCEQVAAYHEHANIISAVERGILQPYTVVWLAINRNRFVAEECAQ